MNFEKINLGKNIPNSINVIIEIQAGVTPVKYEINKDTGLLVVDRVISTPMFYPCHYGFIPNTLADDGDPVDVLVIANFPIHPGAMLEVRPIGMLNMSDEKGLDIKILCVPVSAITSYYDNIVTYKDLPKIQLDQINHFFEKYKDLEHDKWVKIEGYAEKEEAMKIIEEGIKNYRN